jgi:hypothetical protein
LDGLQQLLHSALVTGGDDVPEGAKYLTTTVRHNEFSDAVTHYFLIKKGKK